MDPPRRRFTPEQLTAAAKTVLMTRRANANLNERSKYLEWFQDRFLRRTNYNSPEYLAAERKLREKEKRVEDAMQTHVRAKNSVVNALEPFGVPRESVYNLMRSRRGGRRSRTSRRGRKTRRN